MLYLNLTSLIIFGLLLIIKGADLFVDAASWLAKHFGISDIIIGATVVSIGTTLPEFFSSLTAAIMGAANPAQAAEFNALAVSNALGSMLFNTAVVLALVMLIKPPKTEGKSFVTKGLFLVGVTALLAVFVVADGYIALWQGIVLIAMFLVFITVNVLEATGEIKAAAVPVEPLPITPTNTTLPVGSSKINNGCSGQSLAPSRSQAPNQNLAPISLLKLLLGAAMITLGAILLVDNSQTLAAHMGIPEQIVGLTVVAAGTSLPELVTSLTALKKGKTDIGVGNIIGANIINATLILGVVTAVAGSGGLPIDAITRYVVVWVTLGVTAILVIPSVFLKKTTRAQGGLMLVAYLALLCYNIVAVVRS